MDDLSSPTVQSIDSVNQDPKLGDEQLTKLANELASGILPPHTILKTFNLTPAQLEKYITPNPYFKRVYEAACVEWDSATSAVKRIKIKSAVSLERGLETLHDRMINPVENLPAVVETAKLLAKLAGAGEEKITQGSGERFTISINIGAKQIERTSEPTIDVTPTPALEKPND